ncbi:MAG: DnaJ domain-containing protein [Pseudomonadota bacterium]|nr:DnaJ domain-containing protein [Pseudomonadota bacterium]
MSVSSPKKPVIDTNPVLGSCSHPDCDLLGEFRAPQSRNALDRYYWFCLEHIREYNAAWNYYAGMDDAAVEAEIRNDVVWRRPTWPLGTGDANNEEGMSDPLGMLGRDPMGGPKERAGDSQLQSFTPEEREAVSVLGLVAPVTEADVKLRYKILAKMLHPDANGGDKRAEDRLKSVNYAYTTLRNSDRLI